MDKRSERAFKAFQTRVEELGGTLVDLDWKGANTPHAVKCAQGHETHSRPNHIKNGVGLCYVCTGKDKESARIRFISAVTSLGGVVLDEWKGSKAAHNVRCSSGHKTTVLPNSVTKGNGICKVCSRRCPETAWSDFRESVERAGGVVLEHTWKGANAPHRVRCYEGHEVTPRPSGISRGQGVCRYCAHRSCDVFYVVRGESLVKFGVTSGDPEGRLRVHRRFGLGALLFVRTGLPSGLPLSLEDTVRRSLASAGCLPAKGREYFHVGCTDMILSIVRAALPE